MRGSSQFCLVPDQTWLDIPSPFRFPRAAITSLHLSSTLGQQLPALFVVFLASFILVYRSPKPITRPVQPNPSNESYHG